MRQPSSSVMFVSITLFRRGRSRRASPWIHLSQCFIINANLPPKQTVSSNRLELAIRFQNHIKRTCRIYFLLLDLLDISRFCLLHLFVGNLCSSNSWIFTKPGIVPQLSIVWKSHYLRCRLRIYSNVVSWIIVLQKKWN